MGTSAQVSGPDFTKGVSAEVLKDGETLLGHVGDKAVLLVKVEGEVYAVGANCTHYGGPLNQGLLSGHHIHCPWHHSSFNVKTGEAEKAPALVPLSCWSTEVRDDKVFVTGKKTIPQPVLRGTESQHIVIIGAGAAGTACAVMLRRQGFAGTIQMVSHDDSLPYDRPNLSKDYLAGNAPEEWLPIMKSSFFDKNKILLNLNVSAVEINVDQKAVQLSDGRMLYFDKLLLATGGEPIAPPIVGIESKNVFMLRTLKDCRRIIEKCRESKSVAVVGAGFIGLEVAASLKQRGIDVHVIAPEEMPLMKTLGIHVGSYLKKAHESHGVHFHLGRTVKEVKEDSVILDDGSTIACDFVVVGVGIKPNLSLARQAGCEIDQGVLVNDYLETSIPGIYAAGDIARWPDPRSLRPIRVEHWEVAERHGQVVAANMLGARSKYLDVPFFWTQQYDKIVCYIGFSDRFDRMELLGDPGKDDFAVIYYEDDRVAAFMTVGRDLENLKVEQALQRIDYRKVEELITEYEHHLKKPQKPLPNYFEPSP
ncbi:pyridine nucleotide-disulfide oxidoreductase [Bdellovibrio sp. ZAP7]|uniref:FAD-dependent oxidoreductase n=1 Tax=Bdellovibrio sp. ZAP7 TaxID=2231053 RepID=UPI0011589FDC|nr:FAD-dependent oxidoreductase [Bdellovibrio sp. ZAP7]QDK45050.1 pyridine nucleotide-disulfide oxidoreductase [Bdellovibrio sp. ZAP7]